MSRPTKYTEDLPERLITHFSIEKSQKVCIERSKKYNKEGTLTSDTEKYKILPNDMPTFAGFGRKIEISERTLERWAVALADDNAEAPVKKYPEFCRAYNVAKALQKEFLIDNALQGNSPPASFIFVAKNVTDMTDKQIIETKDADYKDKKDALSDFFDTIRLDDKPEPSPTGTDDTPSQDIQE